MIVEIAPVGWLDDRQVKYLRQAVWKAIAQNCDAIIISGMTLRYRATSGLAELAAIVTDAYDVAPRIPIWLCHISPDLRAAVSLAALDTRWHFAPDLLTTRDAIARAALVSQQPHDLPATEAAIHD